MIRVLRLLEYVFPDYETMERHIEQMHVPLNGKIDFGTVKIRSAAVDSFEQDADDRTS